MPLAWDSGPGFIEEQVYFGRGFLPEMCIGLIASRRGKGSGLKQQIAYHKRLAELLRTPCRQSTEVNGSEANAFNKSDDGGAGVRIIAG